MWRWRIPGPRSPATTRSPPPAFPSRRCRQRWPSDFPATPPFLSRGSGGWQWTRIIAGASSEARLLWDAVARSLRSEIAVFALIVDAKDDQAEAFYLHHGFVPFGSQPRQLVLPLTKLNAKA